jgi:SAM-dependent methyltransferase
MMGPRFRRQLGALSAYALAAAVLVQAQQATKPFEPTVGQAGKDVVWVPTPDALVDRMLDIAQVTPRDYVIDLGSGDGRTVIAAARRGARALGIEYNPDMVALSERNAAAAGVAVRARFRQADLFETDFSEATVLTMFLLPEINLRLRPAILEMAPGTRVVSNSFTMNDWEPDETSRVTEDCTSWCTAYLWIVPAKVEGTWRLAGSELTLAQQFQKLTGTLRTGTNAVPIADGRLRGDEITFTAGDTTYTGRVSGGAMEGLTSGARLGKWSAVKN